MHRTSSKGKARKEKPYTRINLPSVVQDRLSKYSKSVTKAWILARLILPVTGDTAQAGSSSRSDRKGKVSRLLTYLVSTPDGGFSEARKQRDVVKVESDVSFLAGHQCTRPRVLTFGTYRTQLCSATMNVSKTKRSVIPQNRRLPMSFNSLICSLIRCVIFAVSISQSN